LMQAGFANRLPNQRSSTRRMGFCGTDTSGEIISEIIAIVR
jgi:hypothetical protein